VNVAVTCEPSARISGSASSSLHGWSPASVEPEVTSSSTDDATAAVSDSESVE
jgi:hypothetical protein